MCNTSIVSLGLHLKTSTSHPQRVLYRHLDTFSADKTWPESLHNLAKNVLPVHIYIIFIIYIYILSLTKNPHLIPLIPDSPVPCLGHAVRHLTAGALQLLRGKLVVRLRILAPSSDEAIVFAVGIVSQRTELVCDDSAQDIYEKRGI